MRTAQSLRRHARCGQRCARLQSTRSSVSRLLPSRPGQCPPRWSRLDPPGESGLRSAAATTNPLVGTVTAGNRTSTPCVRRQPVRVPARWSRHSKVRGFRPRDPRKTHDEEVCATPACPKPAGGYSPGAKACARSDRAWPCRANRVVPVSFADASQSIGSIWCASVQSGCVVRSAALIGSGCACPGSPSRSLFRDTAARVR